MAEGSQTGREQEKAHDVLAAEAFAVPAPDPVLDHHHRVVLPEDPTGIAEAHDILAAEEFAMPAPMRSLRRPAQVMARGTQSPQRVAVAAGILALAALMFRRLRRA